MAGNHNPTSSVRQSTMAVPTIVTLTLAPCLDISTVVDVIEPWHKLRCTGDRIDAGGGGINVARAVQELGGRATAVAALGGHVGSVVAHEILAEGVGLHRVRVRGATRENFAVSERSTGRQFRFVRDAPEMSRKEWEHCIAITLRAATGAKCVVASGSPPPGVPPDIYVGMSGRLAESSIPFVLDVSGAALRGSLAAPALVVKPSRRELVALVGRALPTVEDCAAAGIEVLGDSQWQSLVVSLGEDGAVLVERDGGAWAFGAPPVGVVSTIGAGDSMVAGIALSLARGGSLVDAVSFGVAAGTAAVLREGTSLCDERDVTRLLPQVAVRRLDT